MSLDWLKLHSSKAAPQIIPNIYCSLNIDCRLFLHANDPPQKKLQERWRFYTELGLGLAKVSISSSKTIFRLLTCYKFFLVSLFVPLLLKCSVETVLNNKTLSAIVNSQNFFLEIHQCVTNPTFFPALFENVLLLFTWVQYDKTQTPFFSALSPETQDQIKLVKYKIGFES